MTAGRPLFTFVHVTDTHYCRDTGMARAFVDLINRETACPLPDHVIHTGDIIRGYNATMPEHYAQMREAKAIFDELRAPAVFTCHNHDTYGEDVRGTVFDDVFGAPHLQEIERDGFYLLILSGALASSDIWGVLAEEGGPQLGFDLYTPKGLRVLASRLGAHASQRKLVFSHAGLVNPRREPVAVDPAEPLPARSGFRYCMSESNAAPIREVLTRYGVAAHYSGHCHLNTRHEVDGVQYISTASPQHFPGEARYVSVFADRIEHRMVAIPGGRDLPLRWPNVCDADHPDTESYSRGNPHERDFTIRLGTPVPAQEELWTPGQSRKQR